MGESTVPAAATPSAPLHHPQLTPGLRLGASICFAIAAAYVASTWLLAGPDALLDETTSFGLHPRVRFNAIYALLIAYTAAVNRSEARVVARDLAALEPALDLPAGEASAVRRALRLSPRGRAAAVGAGVLLGLAIHVVGGLGGRSADTWRGHVVWMYGLGMVLFGLLVPLAARSVRIAHALSALGARARVDLLDRSALAPFSRIGLRGAAYWIVGASIAALLFLDAAAWGIVLAVDAATIGVGIAAFLLPVRGVRARIRAARARELAWVREEIARARAALAGEGAEADARAARLPALLAWEARVADVPEWPFDTPTLVRFALFLLVPIGSWLGGALVERIVDTWMG